MIQTIPKALISQTLLSIRRRDDFKILNDRCGTILVTRLLVPFIRLADLPKMQLRFF